MPCGWNFLYYVFKDERCDCSFPSVKEDSAMDTPLLTIRVTRKRQVVRAAQRARQIGRMLGLAPKQQAALACAVLETASQVAEVHGPTQVSFCLGQVALVMAFRAARAEAGSPAYSTLQVHLPEPLPVSREDLAWMVRE